MLRRCLDEMRISPQGSYCTKPLECIPILLSLSGILTDRMCQIGSASLCALYMYILCTCNCRTSTTSKPHKCGGTLFVAGCPWPQHCVQMLTRWMLSTTLSPLDWGGLAVGGYVFGKAVCCFVGVCKNTHSRVCFLVPIRGVSTATTRRQFNVLFQCPRNGRLIWLAWLSRGFGTQEDIAQWRFGGRVGERKLAPGEFNFGIKVYDGHAASFLITQHVEILCLLLKACHRCDLSI